MEAMVLGGRPLHVLQAPCAGCGSARRTYFVVDDRR
jgi:hypothetical protein